jgi:hypothetical protein
MTYLSHGLFWVATPLMRMLQKADFKREFKVQKVKIRTQQNFYHVWHFSLELFKGSAFKYSVHNDKFVHFLDA